MLQESCAAGISNVRGLENLLPVRKLAHCEEGFYEFPFSAEREIRKALVPLAVGHSRIGCHPSIQLFQLLCPDFSLIRSFEQMKENSAGKFTAANFRHQDRSRRRTLEIIPA